MSTFRFKKFDVVNEALRATRTDIYQIKVVGTRYR